MMMSSLRPEVIEVRAQPRQQLVAAQQPQRAQDAQEADGFADQRRQEGHDRDGVRPGPGIEQVAQPVLG